MTLGKYWVNINCIVLVRKLEVFRKINTLCPLLFDNLDLVTYSLKQKSLLDLNIRTSNSLLFINAKIRK